MATPEDRTAIPDSAEELSIGVQRMARDAQDQIDQATQQAQAAADAATQAAEAATSTVRAPEPAPAAAAPPADQKPQWATDLEQNLETRFSTFEERINELDPIESIEEVGDDVAETAGDVVEAAAGAVEDVVEEVEQAPKRAHALLRKLW